MNMLKFLLRCVFTVTFGVPIIVIFEVAVAVPWIVIAAAFYFFALCGVVTATIFGYKDESAALFDRYMSKPLAFVQRVAVQTWGSIWQDAEQTPQQNADKPASTLMKWVLVLTGLAVVVAFWWLVVSYWTRSASKIGSAGSFDASTVEHASVTETKAQLQKSPYDQVLPNKSTEPPSENYSPAPAEQPAKDSSNFGPLKAPTKTEESQSAQLDSAVPKKKSDMDGSLPSRARKTNPPTQSVVEASAPTHMADMPSPPPATGQTNEVESGASGVDTVFGSPASPSPDSSPSSPIQQVPTTINQGSPLTEPSAKTTPQTASANSPFENTLGMRFVPVPQSTALFCIHEVRRRDFVLFARETGKEFEPQLQMSMEWLGDDMPINQISKADAESFCEWLSAKEGLVYRLPTDHEWSCAVGIADRESSTASPQEKDAKVGSVYPWGTEFPPLSKAGNYKLEGYEDGYEGIAPVMQFTPNHFGIYDLGGNVCEWCADSYRTDGTGQVIRGGGWFNFGREFCLSSQRVNPDRVRDSGWGFRCVLDISGE